MKPDIRPDTGYKKRPDIRYNPTHFFIVCGIPGTDDGGGHVNRDLADIFIILQTIFMIVQTIFIIRQKFSEFLKRFSECHRRNSEFHRGFPEFHGQFSELQNGF